MTIWLWTIFPRLHLRPMTQPFECEITLEPNDYMILTNLPRTSPAHDDSTIRIRVHLRTTWPYDYVKYPRDFACARWLNHSNTSSPWNLMTILVGKIFPRLHLHPMTEPFEYEFTLEPNDHMIWKNLPGTSPAPDDSTIRARVHLRTKWPYDYEKSPCDFTCNRWLNHSHTSSS